MDCGFHNIDDRLGIPPEPHDDQDQRSHDQHFAPRHIAETPLFDFPSVKYFLEDPEGINSPEYQADGSHRGNDLPGLERTGQYKEFSDEITKSR